MNFGESSTIKSALDPAEPRVELQVKPAQAHLLTHFADTWKMDLVEWTGVPVSALTPISCVTTLSELLLLFPTASSQN